MYDVTAPMPAYVSLGSYKVSASVDAVLRLLVEKKYASFENPEESEKR